LIYRVCAITGMNKPPTEFEFDFLVQELMVFLSDCGFGNLSTEEFLLAFRLNCSIILNYPIGMESNCINLVGVNANIDSFSKVLFSYTLLRNNLDSKIKNHIDGY